MNNLVLTGLVFISIFISGCVQSTPSAQIIQCNPNTNLYILHDSLNQEILNDEDAFETLKKYWIVYDPKSGYGVSEGIPSSMTAKQAMDIGILQSGIDIKLNTGETIDNVWMLYNLKAVDSKGNIYYCELIREGSGGMYCNESGCFPLQGKKPE